MPADCIDASIGDVVEAVSPQMALTGWIALAVAGLALAAFAIFEIGKSSRPNSAQGAEDKKQPGQQENYSTGRTDERDQQHSDDRAAKKEGQEGYLKRLFKFVNSNEKPIITLSTLFIAAFTVVLAFATGFLWHATRQLVRGAEQTAERQLRAYISVDAAELRNFGTSEPLQSVLRVKNSGQSPAYKLKTRHFIFISSFPLQEVPAAPQARLRKTTSFLGPGGDIFANVSGDRSLTVEQHEAIKSGERAIYVSFELRYQDIFKVDRFVYYRAYFRGNGNDPGATLSLSQTEEGNDAD